MYYVIVDTQTGKAYEKTRYAGPSTYFDQYIAIGQAKKRNNKEGKEVWKAMKIEDYKAQLPPVNMVERVNLMSGEKYMEAEDTPNFCSPSSESYWSS